MTIALNSGVARSCRRFALNSGVARSCRRFALNPGVARSCRRFACNFGRALGIDMHWQSLVRWHRAWHVPEQVLDRDVPMGRP